MAALAVYTAVAAVAVLRIIQESPAPEDKAALVDRV
jgi:hypothetical protein